MYSNIGKWDELNSSEQRQYLLRDSELITLLPSWWDLHQSSSNDQQQKNYELRLNHLYQTDPIITAADLQNAGLSPSPHYGIILQLLYDQQIQYNWQNKVDAENALRIAIQNVKLNIIQNN